MYSVTKLIEGLEQSLDTLVFQLHNLNAREFKDTMKTKETKINE